MNKLELDQKRDELAMAAYRESDLDSLAVKYGFNACADILLPMVEGEVSKEYEALQLENEEFRQKITQLAIATEALEYIQTCEASYPEGGYHTWCTEALAKIEKIK